MQPIVLLLLSTLSIFMGIVGFGIGASELGKHDANSTPVYIDTTDLYLKIEHWLFKHPTSGPKEMNEYLKDILLGKSTRIE